MDKVQKNYKDEVFDQMVYSELAKTERNPEIKKVLSHLSSDEKSHAETWRTIALKRGTKLSELGVLDLLKIKAYGFYRRVLGLRVTMKLLEAGEDEVIKEYYQLLENNEFSEEERELFRQILVDEVTHEEFLTSENFQLGSVRDFVYGISDGLIEVLAAASGFSGVFVTPLLVALAGIIVGLAGTISMAVGAYLSTSSDVEMAKNERTKTEMQYRLDKEALANRLGRVLAQRGVEDSKASRVAGELKDVANEILSPDPPSDPKKSAYTTGLAYIIGAVIPVLPYAAGIAGVTGVVYSYVTTAVATFIIGFIIGTLSGAKPWRKGVEMTVLAIGAALATRLIGVTVSHFIHITAI
jgi:VIT1/CCC1 family predicted Fe2+/Mn2+ transporter